MKPGRWINLMMVAAALLAAAAPLRGQGFVSVNRPDAAGALRLLNARHYRIHTDLDPALVEDLARRMDAMYDEYDRRLSAFGAAKAPRFEVYLFQSQADYLRFSGERWKNTGGIFMSARDVLAAFLDGQGRDALRRTLQHEAFHQFALHAMGPALPVWLNEGLAQVFEEGLWTGTGFWIGEIPPRRLRQLDYDMRERRLTDFATFMRLDHEQWARRLEDPGAGATQYNQAWAMVHFLVQANDDDGTPRYRARLIRWLQRIHGGDDSEAAFEQVFSANIEGFQKRFVEYARAMTPTPAASYVERMEVLGDMMLELRGAGAARWQGIDEFRDAVRQGRLRLQYTKTQVKWITDPDPERYFRDLDDRTLIPDRLSLSPRRSSELPDIVLDFSQSLRLRTRFHSAADGKWEREVLSEARDGR